MGPSRTKRNDATVWMHIPAWDTSRPETWSYGPQETHALNIFPPGREQREAAVAPSSSSQPYRSPLVLDVNVNS
ncbi:hypothetical protein VTK73DRAFT_9825 [Phialemonium thermophilum]|uniref:Uncharacterized protein n=1 Tax=Phialemonium thermophilum TaxID=223376 RepID=A0ABR3XJH5_9PEZI